MSIGVGVVGCGYWGPNLVRVLSEEPRFSLKMCCDLDAARLERIKRRYPAVRVTQRFEEVLQDKLDAVVIATPISTHAPLAEKVLRAGKHVFVEKPLAASSREAFRLIEVARETNRTMMVGHTFEYSPPVVAIRDLIARGELGKIHYLSSSRVNLGLYQKDVDVVWDLATHDFSIILFWLREMPTHVIAIGRCCVQTRHRDVAFVTLTFPSGVLAHVEVSWLAPSKLRRTTIIGSEKMVIYDDTCTQEKVKICDFGVRLKQPETFGEFQLSYRLGDIVSPQTDTFEPLAEEIRHFADCIEKMVPPRTDGLCGLRVVTLLEAVQESLDLQGGVTEVKGSECLFKAS